MMDDGGEIRPNEEFEQALADLMSGQGPVSLHLAGLSLLTPERLEQFRPAWGGLLSEQKLALISALSRAETEALRLDFNEIYHLGMLDQDELVRRQAIEALLEDESPWVLDRLLSIVADDDAPGVRQAAAVALGEFAARAELQELPVDDAARIKRVLLETLRRPAESLEVRGAALASVGFFSSDDIQREIRAGYDDDYFRVYALRAMGHNADSIWLETIVSDFEDDDDEIRQAAAEAAGDIADDAAIEGLSDLIDDPDREVRMAAVYALGQIGGTQAREILEYLADDEDEELRDLALEMIEELEFYQDPLGG